MLLLISLIDVVLSKGKRRVGAGKESLFLGIFLGMADLAAVGIFFVDLPYKWRSTKNIGNSINVDNLLYLPIHDIGKCSLSCYFLLKISILSAYRVYNKKVTGIEKQNT